MIPIQKIPSRKSIASVVLLAALLASGLASCTREQAPPFSLRTSRGKIIELQKLEGKVVALYFWATWCDTCREEIPAMVETYRRYHVQGLEIIGISVDTDGWSIVTPWERELHITFPVVIADENVTRVYGGVRSIPTTIFINRRGMIVGRHVGMMEKKEFEERIRALL